MARHSVDDETLTFHMNPAVRPGRLERVRRFLRRYPVVRRGLTAAVLAGTASAALLVFGQAGEPPLVVEEDRPESVAPAGDAPTGAVLDRDPVVEARAAVEQRTGQMRAQQSGQTGTIPTPSKVPVQQPVPPPAGPTVPKAGTPVKAEPADDVDDDEPAPVTTSPSEPPEEELTRPGTEPVCWDGWTYDEAQRQCVRDEDLVPPDPGSEEGADDEDPGSEEGEPVTDESGGDEHGAAVPGLPGKGGEVVVR